MREPLGREALIHSLYEAALDPLQWEPIAGRLARAVRASSAVIEVRAHGLSQTLSRTDNFTDDDAATYRTHFQRKDVLMERARARGFNQIHSNSDLMPDDALYETELYRDFLAPRGIHHIAGAILELPGEAISVLSVHRDAKGKPFTAEDKDFLTRLMPHLRTAIRIQHSLSGASLELQAARDFLERSTTALLVVDRAGRLLTANSRGEHLLERSLALTVIAGRVTAAQLSAHHRLIRLIEAAADSSAGALEGVPGGLLSVPFEHQTPLSVTVTPMRARHGGIMLGEPAALLIVRDSSERVDITQMLSDLYGLTPSEALLASGLVNGLTIEEVSLAHGVTINTVRTQLKSVMTKTSTSRQTELVALILRSLAGQI